METYSFHGFIAREATLRVAAQGIPTARFEKLRFGLAYMPLTDDVLAAMGDTAPISVEVEWLSGPAADWARAASERGPVVYVEGVVEGGSGWHAGVAWLQQSLAFGPLRLEERSPVNQALAQLGLEPEAGHDAMSSLKLDEREPG